MLVSQDEIRFFSLVSPKSLNYAAVLNELYFTNLKNLYQIVKLSASRLVVKESNEPKVNNSSRIDKRILGLPASGILLSSYDCSFDQWEHRD